MNFVLQLLQAIGIVGAAVWAATTFWLARRRELAFHRTEFIMKQSEYLDNDPEMRDCTLILYGKHPLWTIEDYLDAATAQNALRQEQAELLIKFEKYLNFLWRIAYAHYELRTLTSKDLDAFGVYFGTAGDHFGLRNFCKTQGYDEIIKACDDLSKAWASSEALTDGPDPRTALEPTQSKVTSANERTEERGDS